MAAIAGRRFPPLLALNRAAIITSVRTKNSIADPIDHATGLEKRELLAKAAGNDDPFEMKVYSRGPGTKTSPNLIPSAQDSRIVGCICEEDATCISWMWLHKGENKRCECGHWFKLVEGKTI